MKVKIRIQNVGSKLLGETKQELVIVKNRKTFVGALFFKKDEDDVLKKVIEEVVIEGSVKDIMLAAYNLLKKYNMTAKDDKTFKTMMHWQFVNGFSDEMFDGYKFKNDTEYLTSLV